MTDPINKSVNLPPVRIGTTQYYYASGIKFTDCSAHGQSIGDKCGCCGSKPREALNG